MYVYLLQTTHKCRSRTYYLAAETEADMNKWVMTLCRVLGLAETGRYMYVIYMAVYIYIQLLLSSKLQGLSTLDIV